MSKLFKNKFVIEVVDSDKFELVVYQADNVKELSKLLNLSKNQIAYNLSKRRDTIKVHNKIFKICLVNVVD